VNTGTLKQAVDVGHTSTVIGGSKRWKDDLNDTSSRIDRQMPPPGAFNVQFQVGGDSYGGVIFTLEDDLETVMNQLIAAYQRGMQAVSPFRSTGASAKPSDKQCERWQKEQEIKAL
jgi:hypothetical protein